MTEDRKRTYQSAASLPKLRPNIGVPPLKMVLVDGDMETPASAGERPDAADGTGGQGSKERTVRKIIAHLQKDS